MGSDDSGERIAVLETKVNRLEKEADKRGAREWAIIMAVFGLLITLFAQNLGWFHK